MGNIGPSGHAGPGPCRWRAGAARMARPKEPPEPTEEDARVMNIVVCVKYVPDAQADRTFTEADNTTDRVGVDGLLSELDEYAVEEALKIARGGRGRDLGDRPDRRARAGRGRAIRKSLQMGADKARARQRRRDPRLRRAGHLAGAGQGDREDRRRRPGPDRHGLDRRHDERRAGHAGRAARAAAGDLRLRAHRSRAARRPSAATATSRPRPCRPSLPALVVA